MVVAVLVSGTLMTVSEREFYDNDDADDVDDDSLVTVVLSLKREAGALTAHVLSDHSNLLNDDDTVGLSIRGARISPSVFGLFRSAR